MNFSAPISLFHFLFLKQISIFFIFDWMQVYQELCGGARENGYLDKRVPRFVMEDTHSNGKKEKFLRLM